MCTGLLRAIEPEYMDGFIEYLMKLLNIEESWVTLQTDHKILLEAVNGLEPLRGSPSRH